MNTDDSQTWESWGYGQVVGTVYGNMYESLTAHPDVNQLIAAFTAEVISEMRDNLVGVYLTGSLSYDAFEHGSSDIDLTVIVRRPVSQAELSSIELMHGEIETQFPEWSKRLECTYTPVEMLPSLLPPEQGRPWYWGGTGEFFAEADYGNEWIINRYFLYEHGIALHGPEFRDLVGPVDMVEVQKACIRDLYEEWKPKASNEEWRATYPYWHYLVLNLCRIVYTVCCASAGTKRAAATWVQETQGDRWRDLVDGALGWRHGAEFAPKDEALAFLDHVISVVSATDLFKEIASELGAP